MTYHLLIADRAYSSWSLRGWLLLRAFGLDFQQTVIRLYEPGFAQALAQWPPARTVPALRLPEGTVIADSLAIAEELASRHPDAGHWPSDPKARAIARALTAEMHASFHGLRGACPMNLRVAYQGFSPAQAVRDDLARLEQLWDWARRETGSQTDWLCGPYGAVDAFFAPVAARIAGYGLPISEQGAAYVQAHLRHPEFRRWRAMSLVDGPDQPTYAQNLPTRAWPGPRPLPAERLDAPDGGEAVNAACPYSGKPVTHFARIGGTVLGFCNAFCRDKTVADPEAWPEAMALLEP